MKTRKPKRLPRDQVIRDLQLLACGAQGCWCELIDICPTITESLSPESLSRFAWAVKSRFFDRDMTQTVGLFELMSAEKWATFDSLADAIIRERHRMDCLAAGETTT